MNNQRRKQLSAVKSQLEELKETVETLENEEQSYYDNMPESFRYGTKGDETEAVIDYISDAVENLGEAITNIKTAIS